MNTIFESQLELFTKKANKYIFEETTEQLDLFTKESRPDVTDWIDIDGSNPEIERYFTWNWPEQEWWEIMVNGKILHLCLVLQIDNNFINIREWIYKLIYYPYVHMSENPNGVTPKKWIFEDVTVDNRVPRDRAELNAARENIEQNITLNIPKDLIDDIIDKLDSYRDIK